MIKPSVGPLAYYTVPFLALLAIGACVVVVRIHLWRGRAVGLLVGLIIGLPFGVFVGNLFDAPDQLGAPFAGFFIACTACILAGYIVGHLRDRTNIVGHHR